MKKHKIGFNLNQEKKMALEVNGKQVEVDEEGYLSNLNDWEKDIATIMAK